MIREARQADMQAIAEIHTNNRREIYKGILSDRYLQHITYEHTRSRWDNYRRKADRKIFVLENDKEEVIGFSALKYPSPDMTRGLLDNLHIRKDFQGYGYGTALIRYCARHLLDKGIAGMYICIVTGNYRAESLYTKLGAEFECDFTDHFEFEEAPSKRFVFNNLEALVKGQNYGKVFIYRHQSKTASDG